MSLTKNTIKTMPKERNKAAGALKRQWHSVIKAKKEGRQNISVSPLVVLSRRLRSSECDWAVAHATGSTQCRQGCCEDAHNHLNDGLPSFLLHSIRYYG